jgi:hypothetical protein
MIALDFAGLHEPVCKGADEAGKENSDFELWSPHDDGRHGSSDKCFLGQIVTYVRRKQDAECFSGEDFERQIMRVPCLCTKADYECDMNYQKNAGGDCEKIPDPLNKFGARQVSEKEEDCALEGFYYDSTGYRKIPGNMCYGGLNLEPSKRACSSFIWLSSIFKSKAIIIVAVLAVALYYGWPIIEAVILVLPIPDPKNSLDTMRNAANSANELVSGALTSNNNRPPGDYSQNFDAEPEAYINGDGDNSDEDIGKPSSGLSYDSDEKTDEELVPSSSGSELIDLGALGAGDGQ